MGSDARLIAATVVAFNCIQFIYFSLRIPCSRGNDFTWSSDQI